MNFEKSYTVRTIKRWGRYRVELEQSNGPTMMRSVPFRTEVAADVFGKALADALQIVHIGLPRYR